MYGRRHYFQNTKRKKGRRKRFLLPLFGLLLCGLLFAGCGKGDRPFSETAAGSALSDHISGELELRYATQFSVSLCDDGYRILSIRDGLQYLLIPDGKEGPPAWMTEEEAGQYTQVQLPAKKIYLAASSAMDLFSELDALSSVAMTSTKAADWGLPEIREQVEADTIHYVGKYNAPDYEALLEEEIDLAVESTMIYHAPQVKEAIEDLDIPVMVERSSYEKDPLGRLEWIRLYGILLEKENEADAFFEDVCAQLDDILGEASDPEDRPRVAFFSINANGAAIVRKPGDYITRMIEMAQGRYALDALTVDEENALSTMQLQMESFYEQAVDADIFLYNSTIEGDLKTRSQLIEKSEILADCKAVREGNVWCTNKNVYQRSAGICDMILEMYAIFHGETEDISFHYFHLLS